MWLNADLEHQSHSCIWFFFNLFFMLLIQGELFLVSDITWLYNCDSFRRRPAQRNKKINARFVVLKCSEITILSIQKLPLNISPVLWPVPDSSSNLCQTHCVSWCCFPSDSLTEGAAEWGQRKKRRVFGTGPTGRWPRLIFLLSFSFDFFFFILFPPSVPFGVFIICNLLEIIKSTRWRRTIRPKFNPWMFLGLRKVSRGKLKGAKMII